MNFFKRFNIRNAEELTEIYLKSDVYFTDMCLWEI